MACFSHWVRFWVPTIALAGCLCQGTATGAGPSSFLPKVKVFVDRVEVHEAGGEIKVPANAKSIDFQIGESVWNSQNPDARRFRYMLEGVDRGWQNRTGDMGLAVFFYDKSGDLLRKRYFWANNNSLGWNGTFDPSRLIPRSEKLTVPPGAEKLSLVISSAGPPDTYGVYVLNDLVLQRDKDGLAEIILQAASRSVNEKNGSQKDEQWARDGTRAPMAQKILLPGTGTEAFCVADDDPLAHAEWHLINRFYPTVRSGEELRLNWNEMYSIGLCDKVSTSYSVPKAGQYRLRVNIVDLMGNPQEESSLRIVVFTPYWMNPWFWAGCLFLFLLCAAWAGRRLVRSRVRNQVRRIEQEQMVERERLRIAQDIHDDLGARLTHISLVSGSAKKESLTLEEAQQGFQKISNMTRELVAALYETVWTVDPGNDHLDSLVGHLIQLIDTMCAPTGIQCRIQAPSIPEHYPVTSSVRHQVSLAVKEALHNAIKYSGASEIRVQVEWRQPLLVIVIADNGRGFDLDRTVSGRGLKNMQERMNAVKGSLEVESSEEKGTRIIFKVPVVTKL